MPAGQKAAAITWMGHIIISASADGSQLMAIAFSQRRQLSPRNRRWRRFRGVGLPQPAGRRACSHHFTAHALKRISIIRFTCHHHFAAAFYQLMT